MAGASPATAIGFERFAVQFHLLGELLSLTGNADPDREGAIAIDAAIPILTAPPAHTSSVVNLLRTLLPDSEYQVPATRQTSALVRLLPLPDVAHAPRAAQTQTHTPTRLAPAPSALPAAIRQPVLR